MRRLVTAMLGAGALVFSGWTIDATAQDKKADKGAPKATIKVLVENDKVRAFETTFAPGAPESGLKLAIVGTGPGVIVNSVSWTPVPTLLRTRQR